MRKFLFCIALATLPVAPVTALERGTEAHDGWVQIETESCAGLLKTMRDSTPHSKSDKLIVEVLSAKYCNCFATAFADSLTIEDITTHNALFGPHTKKFSPRFNALQNSADAKCSRYLP